MALSKRGLSIERLERRELLTVTVLEVEANEALILDVRSPQEFAKGFIPRSINIGLDGSFAPWVGALIMDVTTPILLVIPEEREEEAVTRLARVGFDQN